MKLSEEMDTELNSTARSNPDEAFKPSKSPFQAHEESSKPLVPNGQNDTCVNGILNGHASPNSPIAANLESDALGFEVESYNDFNTSLPPDSHSEDKFDNNVNKSDELKESSNCEDRLSVDSISDIDRLDLTHDSSHISEEFQLRLSDDDDGSEEVFQRNLKISAVGTVSSTTEDVPEASSLDNTIKCGDPDHVSGSGTLKDITLTNDSLVRDSTLNSKPHEPANNCHPIKISEVQNLGSPDKDPAIESINKEQEAQITEKGDMSQSDTQENFQLSSCTIDGESGGENDESKKADPVLTIDKGCKAAECTEDSENISKGADPCEGTPPALKVTSVLSLEDKLEAELEAELQAEIAAELQKDNDKNVLEGSNKDNVCQSTTKPHDKDAKEPHDVKCMPSIKSEAADVKFHTVKEEPIDMEDKKNVFKFDVGSIKKEVEDSAEVKSAVFKEERIHDHNCKCDKCIIDIDDKSNILKLQLDDTKLPVIKTEKNDEDRGSEIEKECLSGDMVIDSPLKGCQVSDIASEGELCVNEITKSTEINEGAAKEMEVKDVPPNNENESTKSTVINEVEGAAKEVEVKDGPSNNENESTKSTEINEVEKAAKEVKDGSSNIEENCREGSTENLPSIKQNESVHSENVEGEGTRLSPSEPEPCAMSADADIGEVNKLTSDEDLHSSTAKHTDVPLSENVDSEMAELSEETQALLPVNLEQSKILVSDNTAAAEGSKSIKEQELCSFAAEENDELQSVKETQLSKSEQESAPKTQESLSSVPNENEVLQSDSLSSDSSMQGNEQELNPSSDNIDTKVAEDDSLDPSNSTMQVSFEPNSPVSYDDYESPGSDIDDPASVDIDDHGAENLNDDSDAMCENDDIMAGEMESESKNKSGMEKNKGLENVPSTKLVDSNLSVSPNFCDSTVLDAPSNDDTDIQDCSTSVNENTNSKGLRKRHLSRSDDDSYDSIQSNKKINGFTKSKERSGSHIDNGHKRPADGTLDSDSKKLRVSDDIVPKEHEELNNRKDSRGQMEEKDRLQNLKRAASLQGVAVSEPLQDPKTSLDLAIERVVTKAATASANTEPMDLPFLKKLHKKELSKMSRSDLEELVVQKICEAITERSIVGDLRLRCQALENRQEKENEKFNKLRKQMTELSLVMRKYMDNQRHNVPNPPIKVTRSVGLQVCQAFRPIVPGVHTSNCPLHMNQPGKPGQPGQPVSKPPTATPSKSDSSLSDAPSQVFQLTPKKVYRSTPYAPRPPVTVNSSTEPPALVPTSTAVLVMPARPVMTPPRIQVPPLQQISGGRPRFNIPSSATSTPAQVMQVQQRQQSPLPKQNPSQNSNQLSLNAQKTVSNDVEVIDIIDKDDQNKRPVGVQISPHQHQHQQKQAANAAAQSLAGNSGMTVRLISPAQVSQTLASGYSQILVPSANGIQQKMILTSSPTGNAIRSNLKLVMKGNQGNVIIPLQQNNGVAVSSSVVHIPSSTQAAVQQIFTNAGTGNRTNTVATMRHIQPAVHPAPLPSTPATQVNNPSWKQIPPRPNLKTQHQNNGNGIVLSWNMALGPAYADIDSYQLFAYQEGLAPPSAGLWKKVGSVKALPLPMACTLTQFVEGHRYHFSVRAVDKHGRVGPFSQQESIRLGN